MDAYSVNDFRQILVRRPFFELTPKGYLNHGGMFQREVADTEDPTVPEDTLFRVIKTQQDFLREFYPSAHKIFDRSLYPDIYRKNPEDGKWYIQEIQRTAFAFQQLIYTKHVLHMTGNDVQFELADDGDSDRRSEENQTLLNSFKKEWFLHDMEVRHYEAVAAYMKVAEAAVVGFFTEDGKFGTRTLSFERGDILRRGRNAAHRVGRGVGRQDVLPLPPARQRGAGQGDGQEDCEGLRHRQLGLCGGEASRVRFPPRGLCAQR